MQRSVTTLLGRYPAARLQDIYKTMFQDCFGVAHMLSSREQVREYITREASTAEGLAECYYEPCGWRGDYIRVDLRAIRDGVITADELTDAFMASAAMGITIDTTSIAAWQREWSEIVRACYPTISRMEGFTADSSAIASHIAAGNYVMHHSKRYNEAYAPHYRILHSSLIGSISSAMKE